MLDFDTPRTLDPATVTIQFTSDGVTFAKIYRNLLSKKVDQMVFGVQDFKSMLDFETPRTLNPQKSSHFCPT